MSCPPQPFFPNHQTPISMSLGVCDQYDCLWREEPLASEANSDSHRPSPLLLLLQAGLCLAAAPLRPLTALTSASTAELTRCKISPMSVLRWGHDACALGAE